MPLVALRYPGLLIATILKKPSGRLPRLGCNQAVSMADRDLSACSSSSLQISQIIDSVFIGGAWHAIPPDLSHFEIEAEMYHFRCGGPVCHYCGSDAGTDDWEMATVVEHGIELRLTCPFCYNSDCRGLACPCAARDLRLWRNAHSNLSLLHDNLD